MNLTIKIGIMIYIIIIIQLSILSAVLYIKSKKNEKLFSLLFVNICGLLWMFFAIIEKFAAGSEYYLFSIRFPLVFIHLLSLAGLIFTLFYLDILNHKNRKNVLFLFIPNLILFLPYFTNEYFYLIVVKCIDNAVVTQWGVVLWASKILSYLYMLIAILLLIFSSIRKTKSLIPNMLMILAFVSPLLLHFLMEFKVFDPHGFDFTPVTFSIVFALYSILSFKYNAVDLRSKASLQLFDNISLPVIIFDKDGMIEDYNDAFNRIFINVFGYKIDKLKTNIKSFLENIQTNCLNNDEFVFLKDDIINQNVLVSGELKLSLDNKNIKYFLMETLLLETKKNFNVGKMMIFYDTTEYKELILLEERFKLSNNIHDSLGNSINVISSNLEYVINTLKANNHKYKKEKFMGEVDECLETSYRKTLEAFMDLRRIVEGLSPLEIEKNGLIWALNSIINKLKYKGIDIILDYNIENDYIFKNREIDVEIYHVCEEALNNAIVHGKANNISISIMQKEGKISLYIIDDGIGCKEIIKNKGLTGMEKRISRIKGRIKYGSPTDGGFNIKIEIPLLNAAEGT